MSNNEFTTMVMIQDKATGKVLVQDRVKSWKGLSFPGGHIEDGESFYDCAVREIKEETGAKNFTLDFVSIYTVTTNEKSSGGYLFYSEKRQMLKR